MPTVGEGGHAQERRVQVPRSCRREMGKGAPQQRDSPDVPMSQGREQGIYPKQLSEGKEPA